VIQSPLINPPRALGQALAPPRYYCGSQQQHLHARGENRIPRVDGVLAIA
jgi:hypothetical protein